MSDEPRKESAAEIARETAVRNLVGQLICLGVTLGVSWAIMNRDRLWQLRQWAINRYESRHADPHARQVAEFRRELADIERGSDGSGIGRAEPGMYGQDTGRF